MTHDPMCLDEVTCETGCCQCALIAKVRQAIVDGLKTALPKSDTRDSAVAIATFAVSAT